VTTRRGRIALSALAGAAAVLILVELALGAISFGETKLADPCTSKPAFSGGGLDGAVQRFALSGLNGAACDLHTTREELVLSFTPSAQTKIRWSNATIDSALRAGLERAAHDTAGDGLSGRVLAFLLREIIAQPLEWFLDGS
jgi:hypothetical protein